MAKTLPLNESDLKKDVKLMALQAWSGFVIFALIIFWYGVPLPTSVTPLYTRSATHQPLTSRSLIQFTPQAPSTQAGRLCQMSESANAHRTAFAIADIGCRNAPLYLLPAGLVVGE